MPTRGCRCRLRCGVGRRTQFRAWNPPRGRRGRHRWRRSNRDCDAPPRQPSVAPPRGTPVRPRPKARRESRTPLHPREGVVASRPRLGRSPASVPAAAARLGSRRSVPPWRVRSRRSARQRSARRCASRRPTVRSRPRVQRARATSTQTSLPATQTPDCDTTARRWKHVPSSLDQRQTRQGLHAPLSGWRSHPRRLVSQPTIQAINVARTDHGAYRGLLTQLFVLPMGHGSQGLAEVRDLVSYRRVGGHDLSKAVDFRGLSTRVPPEESAGLTPPRATLSPRQCLTSTYADGGSPPSPNRLTSPVRRGAMITKTKLAAPDP